MPSPTLGEIPPPSDLLPADFYHIRVEELTESKIPFNPPVVGFKMKARLVEPMRGRVLFHDFVVGNESDPDAQDPMTWQNSRGARLLGQLLALTGNPRNEPVDAIIAKGGAVGGEVVADVGIYRSASGAERQTIYRFFPLGERKPGSRGAARGGGGLKTPPPPAPFEGFEDPPF